MALAWGLISRFIYHQNLDVWVMINVTCAFGFVLTFFLSWEMALVLAIGTPLLVTVGTSLLAKPGAEQGLEALFFIGLSVFFVPSIMASLAIKFVARRI